VNIGGNPAEFDLVSDHPLLLRVSGDPKMDYPPQYIQDVAIGPYVGIDAAAYLLGGFHARARAESIITLAPIFDGYAPEIRMYGLHVRFPFAQAGRLPI
jgi:hypothetical protein